MERENIKNVIILGAGPAGLVSAYLYQKKGFQVTVVEKTNAIGGLSRGVEFLGNKYDLGPHSFYSNYSSETKDFFDLFIGKNSYSKVKPSKLLQTSGSVLFHSPFRFIDVLKLRNLFFFSAYAFYRFKAKFSSFKKKNAIDRHGHWLRKKIFEPYCKKYFNLEARLVSSRFIELLYTNNPDDEGNYIYIPDAGYIGKLWENVYHYLQNNGVKFEFNQHIVSIETDNTKIALLRTQENTFEGIDVMVSTIPLQIIHKLIFPSLDENIALKYRATIIVFIEVERLLTDALYLTNYDTKSTIGRISFCSNWRKEKTRKPVISVEIWCDENDEIFNQSESIITQKIISPLLKSNVLEMNKSPNYKVIKIPKCYPVLEKGYDTPLSALSQKLNTVKNLTLIGRHGKFQWDGIDDIIYAAHHE